MSSKNAPYEKSIVKEKSRGIIKQYILDTIPRNNQLRALTLCNNTLDMEESLLNQYRSGSFCECFEWLPTRFKKLEETLHEKGYNHTSCYTGRGKNSIFQRSSFYNKLIGPRFYTYYGDIYQYSFRKDKLNVAIMDTCSKCTKDLIDKIGPFAREFGQTCRDTSVFTLTITKQHGFNEKQLYNLYGYKDFKGSGIAFLIADQLQNVTHIRRLKYACKDISPSASQMFTYLFTIKK